MRSFKPFFLSTLSATSAQIQIPLQSPASSPLTKEFAKLVHQNLEQWRTPGIAISIVDGDETFAQGYGIAAFPDKPVTPETLFYTGSTTKSFTSAAVSLLIDDTANTSKPLSWQTPLSSLIRSDFVLQEEYTTSHATLEDALSHRTGLPRHDLGWSGPDNTVEAVVRNLRHLPLTAEPRTRWQYCNLMYITVSHFIERWTGMWLGDFLRTRIYEPLNMTDTYFSLSDAQAGKAPVATPYYWDNHTQEYHSLPYEVSSQTSGAGATISNVLDFAKWIRCMMTTSPPLSPAGHDAVLTPRMSTKFNPTNLSNGFRGTDNYALGWGIMNYRGEIMHWHSGGLPGFVTMMLYFPRLQWGLSMMANGGSGEVLLILTFQLIDDMLGVSEKDRYDWALETKITRLLGIEILKHAKELSYPDAPTGNDALPLPLPLKAYAGAYHNPGYPSVNLTLSNSTLHGVIYLLEYPISLNMIHVSNNYFLLYARMHITETLSFPLHENDHDPTRDSVTKAEFRLGEDGMVAEVGINIEPEMGNKKIWFCKGDCPQSGHDSLQYKPFKSSTGAFSMVDPMSLTHERTEDPSSSGMAQGLSFSNVGNRMMAPLFQALS